MKRTLWLAAAALVFAHAAPAAPTTDPQTVYRQAVQAGQKGDYRRAFRLLKPLADRGDAVAQNNIAVLYRDGLGVTADNTQALKWYSKAAAQGIAEAQFEAGLMHARGQAQNKISPKPPNGTHSLPSKDTPKHKTILPCVMPAAQA